MMSGAVGRRPGRSHPLFARVYVFLSRFGRDAVGRERTRLLAGLAGRVVELGAGHGDNFEHYPPTVSEVVAVEPEPFLRARALAIARAASVPVTVCDGVGERLPFADGSFDAAVVSLVLCSVEDPQAVIDELHRVLRPAGELRFFEHVRSDATRRAAVQRWLDDSGLWPRLAGGCHCSRATLAAIERRFGLVRVDRVSLAGAWSPADPMLLGVAVRRGDPAGADVAAY